MQFGIFGSAQASTADLGPETGQGFRDYLDMAVEAEALGYRSSFLVEHHFTGWNQVSATLMLQTALAMRTTRLRLGTAVIVLPWHNLVLLAEQAATLDLVSNGRFDFGIGKGYRHNEFAGFRIPIEEAEPRFEESVEVMTRAFVSRERFSHRGRFWQFDDIVVEPPPAQKPHPPFWVAAASDASIRRAARRGFNLILDQYASPEQHGRRIALFRAERLAAGLPFDPMQVAVARQLHVANDKAEAAQALKRAAAATQRTKPGPDDRVHNVGPFLMRSTPWSGDRAGIRRNRASEVLGRVAAMTTWLDRDAGAPSPCSWHRAGRIARTKTAAIRSRG